MTACHAVLLRRPVEPQIFLRRAIKLEIMLAIIQLCHLLIFVESNPGDFVVWLIVHIVALFSLGLLRHSARHCVEYVCIPWRALTTLLLFSLVFKISSRVPYIQNWFTDGLLANRNSAELGMGGWYTYGSVFFYPLSILLAFCTLPCKIYRFLFIGVLTICCIDFIAMGTRNAPMFVLLFYLLSINIQFKIKRAILLGGGLFFIFVAIFNYSTVNRTHASGEGNFEWSELLQFTSSTEVLKIDNKIVTPISQSIPALMPVIFLSHYLTHPISELSYFVSISGELSLAGFYGVKDQLCVVGACDRVESQQEIEKANPRAGVYQTIWTSLILDFGWAGAFFIYTMTVAFLYWLQTIHQRHLGISLVIFCQIIVVSPIENYLYNGLGLVQFSLIILSYLLIRFLYFIGFNLGSKRF